MAAPWSALPIAGDEQRYLIEQYQLRFVISGRALIVRDEQHETGQPVILANPSFDRRLKEEDGVHQTAIPRQQAGDKLSPTRFAASARLPKAKPLPNTLMEALAIRPEVAKYTKKEVLLYEGSSALESVAKSLRSPKVATFATHGFFLQQPTPAINDHNQQTGVERYRDIGGEAADPTENPLLRCGLLLAGCNNREAVDGDNDGILTGMEIVGIDFRGTELVVLSACETGVGEVRNGEGVAGLRQAFQLAGAEAVVSTLWQVPDRDSALLMSKFFEELSTGKTKSEALRNAQLERIEKRRERYGDAHPFFWAAFTLTGN